MELKELIFIVPVILVSLGLLCHYIKEKTEESKKKELPK